MTKERLLEEVSSYELSEWYAFETAEAQEQAEAQAGGARPQKPPNL